MSRFLLLLFATLSIAILSFAGVAFAGVTVSAPANGSNVATTVQYVASASTTCGAGVSSIGIYTAPGVLAYSTSGSSLNTELSLNPGDYATIVQEWDNCGGIAATPVAIHVAGPAAEVQVVAPQNNTTAASQIQYIANATTG